MNNVERAYLNGFIKAAGGFNQPALSAVERAMQGMGRGESANEKALVDRLIQRAPQDLGNEDTAGHSDFYKLYQKMKGNLGKGLDQGAPQDLGNEDTAGLSDLHKLYQKMKGNLGKGLDQGANWVKQNPKTSVGAGLGVGVGTGLEANILGHGTSGMHPLNKLMGKGPLLDTNIKQVPVSAQTAFNKLRGGDMTNVLDQAGQGIANHIPATLGIGAGLAGLGGLGYYLHNKHKQHAQQSDIGNQPGGPEDLV